MLQQALRQILVCQSRYFPCQQEAERWASISIETEKLSCASGNFSANTFSTYLLTHGISWVDRQTSKSFRERFCIWSQKRCSSRSFSRRAAVLLSYRRLLTAPPYHRLIVRRATRSPCRWCFSITPISRPLPVAPLSTRLDNTTSAWLR